jgi:oxygen-dependent protoporphyrinogen oxidase
MTPHVVIVGGGLAGLVVAHALDGAARLTVLERRDQPGGKIRTDLVDGFLIESGPDSFLTSKPQALELCAELGISHEVEGTIPRKTRGLIARNGKLHPIPEGLSGLVPARLGPMLSTSLLSAGGRARFLAEWLIPPRPAGDDESIASFATRRFGEEAWHWLIEPLLAGIHGGDGQRLSLRATFPSLVEAERRTGSVLTALRDTKRSRRSRPSPFVAPRTGMSRLTDALLDSIDAEVATRANVTAVSPGGNGWIVTANDSRMECDAVVLAIPANAAARLLEGADPQLANALDGIEFASTTVVNLAYDAAGFAAELDGYGYLNPPAGGRDVIACTWTSSKFEHRAPPGGNLIRCFLPGPTWADPALTSDDDIVAACRDEMRDTIELTSEPRWARVTRWPASMPQYTIGHLDRLLTVDRALGAHTGLFVTGNSYRGVGIPDTIAHARFVANRILQRYAGDRAGAEGDTETEDRS